MKKRRSKTEVRAKGSTKPKKGYTTHNWTVTVIVTSGRLEFQASCSCSWRMFSRSEARARTAAMEHELACIFGPTFEANHEAAKLFVQRVFPGYTLVKR